MIIPDLQIKLHFSELYRNVITILLMALVLTVIQMSVIGYTIIFCLVKIFFVVRAGVAFLHFLNNLKRLDFN